MLSVVRAALRSRRRQYEVRDYLAERRRVEGSQAYLVRLGDTLRPLSDPDEIQAAANRTLGSGPGSVGVVVGATVTDPPDVSGLGGPVLVPGIGAQGGQATALKGLGGATPGQLLPAVSREVLRAGPDVAALRAAGERMRDAVAHLAG